MDRFRKGSTLATATKSWPDGWLGIALIAVPTFVAYISAMRGGFIWDDDSYVTANPLLNGVSGLWQIWTTAQTPQYYPLTFTMLWIEKQLWGFEPLGYHIVNVLLHAANGVLVWMLLQRIGVRAAWLIGAVFAVHPVEVESVAWIAERKNVLSGFFYFLSAWCFLGFEDGKRGRWYVFSLLLFVCALLSKTVTSTLPAALVIVRWMRGRKLDRAFLWSLVPFFVLGVGMGTVTVWYEKLQVGARGTAWNLTVADRVVLAGKILWFYVGKILWPWHLAFMYERWSIDASAPVQWIPTVSFVIVAGLLWGFRERIGREWFAAVAYFTVTLAPALGFFDVYPMRYSYVADHFQYLASLGILGLAVGAAARVAEKAFPAVKSVVPARVLGAGLLAVLALLTWRQGFLYKDSETLWKDTIAKTPSCYMAYNNLGLIYYARKEYDPALKLLETGRQIQPQDVETYNNIGVIYLQRGEVEKARGYFEQAVAIDPTYSDAHNNLGSVYYSKRDYRKSLEHFEIALANARMNKELVQRNVDLVRKRVAQERVP